MNLDDRHVCDGVASESPEHFTHSTVASRMEVDTDTASVTCANPWSCTCTVI